MIDCHHLQKEFQTSFSDAPVRWQLEELHIDKGERVLITGPSGCGKTTLLNLLAGLLRPDSGTIAVDGIQVEQLSISEADIFRGQHIGLVFQSFHLLAPLTVMENILIGARFGRKLSGHEASEKARVLLEQVGLTGRANYRPGKLSNGEQQRVAIARALINEPPVLLADEPTASLDKANSSTVLDLLFNLCDLHGTTLLAVSHDLQIAERFTRCIDASSWMQATALEVAHV